MQQKSGNVAKLFLVATRLHNFCINEWLTSVDATDENIANQNATPDDVLAFTPSNVNEVTNIPGNLMMRDFLVQRVVAKQLQRPTFNVARNLVD